MGSGLPTPLHRPSGGEGPETRQRLHPPSLTSRSRRPGVCSRRLVLCIVSEMHVYCSLLNTHVAGRGQVQPGRLLPGAAFLGSWRRPRGDQLFLPRRVAGGSLSKGISLSGMRRGHSGSPWAWGGAVSGSGCSSGQGAAHHLRKAAWLPGSCWLGLLQPGRGPLPGQRLLQFGFKKQSVTWAVRSLSERSLLAAAPAQVEHTPVALRVSTLITLSVFC